MLPSAHIHLRGSHNRVPQEPPPHKTIQLDIRPFMAQETGLARIPRYSSFKCLSQMYMLLLIHVFLSGSLGVFVRGGPA